MARTNRKDVPPAASSVDALDDLNLDDMFEGGDDSLFDGLDIDLDMGEISGALDDKKEEKSLDAMDFDLLGPGIPDDTTTSSKRRKTKRKSKTPPPLEEEDLEEVSPSKKKRRSTKSTKKSKSKSKRKEEPPSPAGSSSSTKSKTKVKTSNTMPPPLPRGTSGGMVAAAGQFGGRTQKRTSYTLPLASSSSEKSKTKTKASTSRPPASDLPLTAGGSKAKGRATSISSVSSRGSFTRQQQDDTLNETAQDDTFCGLKPSSTLFFPFMPTLPQEPSMKRCHKLYPCLESIHTLMNNHANSSNAAQNQLLPNSPSINEALFHLLVSDNDHHPSPSDSSSSQVSRRTSLASGISAARNTLSQLDTSKLVSDLDAVCGLLKRQHDFINQSVENMERWCRDHFNELDHAAVFDSSMAASDSSRKRKLTLEPPANQGIVSGKMLSGFGGAVVRVKIKCVGFKEPKMSAVLVAQIPAFPGAKPPTTLPLRPPGVVASAPKVEATKKQTSKKRKAPATVSLSSKATAPSSSTPVVVAPEAKKVESYVNQKPPQRRERIIEEVERQARRLEVKYVGATESRHLALIRQEAELQKVVEDDEKILLVNTSTLWKWIEKSAYFANYTKEDVKEVLHYAWQPEINDRGILGQEVPPVHITSGRPKVDEQAKDLEKQNKTPKTSVNSLFDRLQSLLVDEGSDDGTVDSDDESLDGWTGERNGSKVAEPAKESCTGAMSKGDILDLSELNLEERTYIQLRSIGLVDIPFLPSPQPVLIEEEPLSDDSDRNDDGDVPLYRTEEESPLSDYDDLGDVLRAMQSDLAELHKLNNSRTALLQAAATTHLSVMERSKRKQEEQSQQVARYNLLLKKQKETKRSARQKTVRKDEDWVPW